MDNVSRAIGKNSDSLILAGLGLVCTTIGMLIHEGMKYGYEMNISLKDYGISFKPPKASASREEAD